MENFAISHRGEAGDLTEDNHGCVFIDLHFAFDRTVVFVMEMWIIVFTIHFDHFPFHCECCNAVFGRHWSSWR